MKGLSLLVTVLLAGGLPLTAAALDYGPGQPMLAAETGAPRLPVAQSRAPAVPAVSDSAATDDTNADTPAPVTARSARTESAPNVPALRRPAAARHGKPQRPAKPTDKGAGQVSWQSLLPGSIQ